VSFERSYLGTIVKLWAAKTEEFLYDAEYFQGMRGSSRLMHSKPDSLMSLAGSRRQEYSLYTPSRRSARIAFIKDC
jgi:hypothetical protein